jgi:hypothetical protein
MRSKIAILTCAAAVLTVGIATADAAHKPAGLAIRHAHAPHHSHVVVHAPGDSSCRARRWPAGSDRLAARTTTPLPLLRAIPAASPAMPTTAATAAAGLKRATAWMTGAGSGRTEGDPARHHATCRLVTRGHDPRVTFILLQRARRGRRLCGCRPRRSCKRAVGFAIADHLSGSRRRARRRRSTRRR